MQKPIKIQIDNVHDLQASVNLSNNHLHEGSSINSTVGNINVSGDNNIRYTLRGTDNDYFSVSSNGEIKLSKNLDYSTKNIYDLKLRVIGKKDIVDVPFTVIIKENEAPIIASNCLNGCSFNELSALGSTIVESSREDNDSDNISYSLENDFEGKFSIDQTTGKVSLANKLDFESQSSYELKIKATDSKNLTDTKSVSLNVTDVSISPSAEFKISSEAVSEKNDFVLIREDIDSLSDNEQIILKASSNFTDSLSTFSLSGPDANKFEINNQGEVRAKDLSNGSLIGGINFEKQIP